jgi:alpha-tubulin suppressor-like RCC1 family protein
MTPKVIAIVPVLDVLVALDDQGKIYQRVRNQRVDPNQLGRNPDSNWMWVEIAGPLP